MDIEAGKNLRSIIDAQKAALQRLEAECRAMEASDTVRENVALKAEMEKLRAECEKAKGGAAALSAENANLKNALYEQIYSEKTKIVNTTQQKLDVYFKASADSELNMLTMLETTVRTRIDNMTEALRRNNVDAKDELYGRLGDLAMLLNEKVTAARAEAADMQAAFSDGEREAFETLKNEQITDEQVRAVTKKNNFERFVGLNVLNVIGIFLIIVGMIAAARYTYLQLDDTLKGIMMFALGAAMLAAGEFMNRKKPNIFSVGITAGGVGLLYVALATSYFVLEILGMYPAIGICVLITAAAFLLATRYRAQAVLVFALIGGYLPLLSIDGGAAMTYGAMAYFVVLNVLALLAAFRHKWRAAMFAGLFLNMAGTVYITSSFEWPLTVAAKVTSILYVLFAFMIYTLIPIVSTYRTKAAFRRSDVVLLAMNTLFGSGMMYIVFNWCELKQFNGALAVVFAVAYLFLGKFIEMKFEGGEKKMRALFYLTGFSFVVLVVPLQFGAAWLSLGWLAEGVALAVYGILRGEKSFKRAGLIISGLCLWTFVLLDCIAGVGGLFAYKYLAMTAGSLLILGAYMWKRQMAGGFVRVYKYFAMVNLWVYMVYLINSPLATLVYKAYAWNGAYRMGYLLFAATVAVTFALAYAFPRIKRLTGRGMTALAAVMYIAGSLGLLVMNGLISPINMPSMMSATFGVIVVGTVILLVVGALAVLAMRDLLQMFVRGRKVGVEWYPLVLSGYVVVVLTQNLVVHYNLAFSSFVISIIYVVTALLWIVFGFMRRYSFIRRFGLGLAILAVVKLFLIDLPSLTQGYQIVSYFVLGVTLIAISFVYQYFSKRLELKMEAVTEVAADAKED